VKSLSGRRALVTGGSRGIGAGVARCPARDGADVAVVYRRDDAAASATAQQLRGHGGPAIAVRADVGDLLLAATGHDDFAAVAPSLPIGDVGTPEDIGEIVAFLVSKRGARITNQIVEVDGGQSSIDVDLELAWR
jgi:NAD(P)-dependent dehydrogenase (short-subunit alcohol dehydrogenase family)